jgi:glucosamine--fructose-6-phosphate aminotransferase (isomerizing)
VVFSRREPGKLVAARAGNAGGVVVGYGQDEMFLASDLPALLPHTQRVAFLADGEIAAVTPCGVSYLSAGGAPLTKEAQTVSYDPLSAARGHYKHFMLKEISEQPESVLDTIRGRALFDQPGVVLEDVAIPRRRLRQIKRVVLVGMGTSLHAAMVGRHYVEQIAGLPAEVDNASEFRYRRPLLGPSTLVVSVGQSGETVDTLAAMDEARRQGALQVTVCNVVGSQATRVADGVVYTRCGLEVGVCSTKTFTASIIALYLLACYLAQERDVVDKDGLGALLDPLARLPSLVGRVTQRNEEYERLAQRFLRYDNFLYLGRGLQVPIAMEGALKLKEVSYIHAEGYPAGEMKHGPIALVDESLPVVVMAVPEPAYEKTLGNIEEVRARGGHVIAVVAEADTRAATLASAVLTVPQASPLLAPLLTVLPLQLLAYHVADLKGTDVDQPRNLAKSVTVE